MWQHLQYFLQFASNSVLLNKEQTCVTANAITLKKARVDGIRELKIENLCFILPFNQAVSVHSSCSTRVNAGIFMY
jgi:hypothetical protein